MSDEFISIETMNTNGQVLLDEEAKIIIEDEETKRELRRTRMLHRRNTLELGVTFEPEENDDFNETTSNDATEAVSNFNSLNIVSLTRLFKSEKKFSEIFPIFQAFVKKFSAK